MTTLLAPNACQTMADLRVQIDAIDTDLIGLLVKRSHYIDRAVDLKKIEGLPARTTDRVAAVLDKVSTTASEQGLDPDLAHKLWAEPIEWSIQREIKELGQ
ncbi:chorismate mutase [Ruegeria sp. HKCCE3926]|uniref:chorismate mutase n=1 Tax=Ruegeria sp. HKCCE3926 TaxID=2794831 RepID=UPI001AE34B52|nr:chorismate mutase [Ruegeria sp. HKCCE3926]